MKQIVFLLSILILASCSNPKSSAEFMASVQGQYLFNSDESIGISFKDNMLQICWRGNTNVDYLKVNDSENPFIITGIENFNTSISIPLVVQLDENREVNFKINMTNKFDDISIFLNDKVTGEIYNLSKNNVSLNLVQGKYSDRFFITFKYMLLEDVNYEYIKLYHNTVYNSIIIRKSNPVDVLQVKIYDINGRLIFEENTKDKKNRIEFLLKRNFRTGIYIVKVETNKGIITQKIKL